MNISIQNGGVEKTLMTADEGGIFADELLTLLLNLKTKIGAAAMARMPVALCLDEVESHTTRIVMANNEQDNSQLWLHVDGKIVPALVDGLTKANK